MPAVFSAEISDSVLGIFGTVLATGVRIAAPVVATVLILEVALGTISRMVPQMNIFVIGMPLKIIIGLIMITITIPMFISVMQTVFELMETGVVDYLKELNPG